MNPLSLFKKLSFIFTPANLRRLSAVLLCLVFLASSPAFCEDAEAPKKKRTWREYFTGGDKGRSADDSEASDPEGMVDLIDSPTTNVVDYGAYRLNFRLYSQGGLLSHLSFGVFRRLNLGASWDNEKVIGSDTPTTNKPTLNVKLRAYDGGEILPSFAIGYDGQGRFFDKTADEYGERELGLYGVFGREVFFPDLQVTGGANIAQFKDGIVRGFVGLSYTIEKKFVLMTEYENIRVGPENRWNAGLRILPIPALGIDFSFRRIASNKDKERVVRINFVGSF